MSGWCMRRCRRTYRWQRKRREHTEHMYSGTGTCRDSIWRCNKMRRVHMKPHCLQTSSSNRRWYFSGSRWRCVVARCCIRPASRLNWRPHASHVRWQASSCIWRRWIRRVNSLPISLPQSSHRCSTVLRWTVEMWSFSIASSKNVREQCSQTNNFCAWSQYKWQQAC